MSNSNKGGRKPKGKRRYFRRKTRTAQSEESGAEKKPPRGERDASAGRGKSRSRRRSRRRSREQRSDGVAPIIRDIEDNYVKPDSVYIYNHVNHSAVEHYEFRSERFGSQIGRRIEDFNIDISPLIPHILDPITEEEKALAAERREANRNAATARRTAWENTPEEEEDENGER